MYYEITFNIACKIKYLVNHKLIMEDVCRVVDRILHKCHNIIIVVSRYDVLNLNNINVSAMNYDGNILIYCIIIY